MSEAIIPSSLHNDIFLDEEINITNKEYINNHITTNYYFNLFTDPNKNSQEQLFTKSKIFLG